MVRSRCSRFCRCCNCNAMFDWREPPHDVYSALTVALIAGQFVTLAVGPVVLALWVHRIAATKQLACLHCGTAA